MFFPKFAHAGVGVLLFMAAAAGVPAAAQNQNLNPIDVQLVRQTPAEYTAGQPLEIVVSIHASTTEGLTALGIYETIPPGWQYLSLRPISSDAPSIVPPEGTVELLQFAYITVPPFPITFAYSVLPPEDASGTVYFSGQVEYRTNAGALKSAPVISQIGGPDNAPPVITLLGDNPLTLEQGTPYQEPGYTATDNVDGDVSNRVRVLGVVDFTQPGQYTLTYLVSDRAGNEAAPTQRIVEVIPRPSDSDKPDDTNPPPSDNDSTPGRVYRGGRNYDPEASSASTARRKDTTANRAGSASAKLATDKKADGRKGDTRANPDNAAQPENQSLLEAFMRASAAAPGPPGAASKRPAGASESSAPSAGASATPPDSPSGPAAATQANAPALNQDDPVKLASNVSTAVATASTPSAPSALSPGLLARASQALTTMTFKQTVTLAVVMVMGLAILILVAIGWRTAYGGPPRRRPTPDNKSGAK